MEPIAYLTVEVKHRDLEPRLLIASHLVKAGITVVVGQQWAMFPNPSAFPPGIVLFKTVNEIQRAFDRAATINDITTNVKNPPQFVALAKVRPKNTVAYPARFASLQQEAYPDLKTLTVDRPPEEAFELVTEALRRLKIKIVREDGPTAQNPKGTLEATDRTLVFGFYDDMAIRVEGQGQGMGQGQAKSSIVDIRSASRYGRHDLGRNAERIRAVLKEFVARLEATVPTATGERIGSLIKKKRLLKRAKDGLLKSMDPKNAGAAAPADAPRAPQQKAQPPPKDAGRGRGRRQGQSFE